MTWNTWTVQVSQRHYRAYKRGGTWIEPSIWRACRAKEAQEQRSLRWGAGGGQPRSSKPSGQSANTRPKPRLQQPESKAAGLAPQPPKATVTKPAAATDRTAELLAQLEHFRKLFVSAGLPVPEQLAAPQPSRTEQEATNNLWAQRRVDAAKKLSHWEGQKEAVREKQRRVNREVQDVAAHIRHFQLKIQAVDERVNEMEWARVCEFTNTDWAADSQAGDVPDAASEPNEDDMSAADHSTDFWSKPAADSPIPPAVHVGTAPPIALSNQFQLLTSEHAFQQTASPFQEGAVPASPQDSIDMDTLRRHTIATEGHKQGIHAHYIHLACEQGYSWAKLQEAHETATVVYNCYMMNGLKTNLQHNPLALQIAEHMAVLNPRQPEDHAQLAAAAEASGGVAQ